MKWAIIIFFFLSCASKINKSKWPFPEARKCADYYKELSELNFSLAKYQDYQMVMTPTNKSIDSLMNQQKELNRLGKMYSDSSYYFLSIIDGK